MNVIKRIFIASLVCTCWLLTSPVIVFAGGNFTIVTKPSLGFKEGSTVYKLGQPISAFLASFGPAEIINKDEYDQPNSKRYTQTEYARQYLAYSKSHYYVNDGLIITENTEGAIKGIIFYLATSQSMKSANVKTEEGINSGASLREIVKIYGEPFKKSGVNLLGYQYTEIYYKYGNDVLSFDFKDGVLDTISINAEYLPYLK
jgi:hypothetical protein